MKASLKSLHGNVVFTNLYPEDRGLRNIRKIYICDTKELDVIRKKTTSANLEVNKNIFPLKTHCQCPVAPKHVDKGRMVLII